MTTHASRDPSAASDATPSIARPLALATAIAEEVAAVHATEVDRAGRFPRETIDALRDASLLSAGVPVRLGGAGADLTELAAICSVLARACASSGMVYAMHCIQVASIVHHTDGSPELEGYLRSLVEEQRLIASVTSEVGTGGDLRSSITHVEWQEGEGPGRFRLDKATTASSYCEFADDLLLTARRTEASPPGDQVCVLLERGRFEISEVGEWDTLGMRGTCSPPARIIGEGYAWQVLPVPFRDIAPATMVPVSHILWAGVWLGIASDAYERARRFLQIKSRKDPDGSVLASNRLAGLATRLSGLRAQLAAAIANVEARPPGDAERAADTGAVLAINDLKLAASEAVVEIVNEAIQVIGIAAYKNDGDWSLGRQLRDAHSAALMINNDRIRSTNADLLLVYKGR